jgi:hypothetical protein
MPKKRGGGGGTTTKAASPARTAYRKKQAPYDRSPRSYVKSEAGPKKAAAVGRAVASGNVKPYRKVVKKATTATEARGAVKNLRQATKAASKKKIGKAPSAGEKARKGY